MKGAEMFMGGSPAGQGVPPGRPPPGLRNAAIAVLQSADSVARFWARQRIAPRPSASRQHRMDIVDRNQPGSLLTQQFGDLEVGNLVRKAGEREAMIT